MQYQDRPTTLGIDIVLNGVSYHYEFSIQGKTVVREILTKKFRRTEKLIERTSSFKDILLRSELKGFESTGRKLIQTTLKTGKSLPKNNREC